MEVRRKNCNVTDRVFRKMSDLFDLFEKLQTLHLNSVCKLEIQHFLTIARNFNVLDRKLKTKIQFLINLITCDEVANHVSRSRKTFPHTCPIFAPHDTDKYAHDDSMMITHYCAF